MGVLIPPLNQPPRFVTPATPPAFTLAELQGFVGGYIEAIVLPWEARTGIGGTGPPEPLVMFCNEHGKQHGLLPNGFATELARRVLTPGDFIVGPVIVCTWEEAGEGSHDEPEPAI